MTLPNVDETIPAICHRLAVEVLDHAVFVRLAAIGLTRWLWRNSPVEDAHAGTAPLSDGDMLRLNSMTTREVTVLLTEWESTQHVPVSADGAWDVVTPAQWEALAAALRDLLTKRDRSLPDGSRVRKMLPSAVSRRLTNHVNKYLALFGTMATPSGANNVLASMAVEGAISGSRWWGHPDYSLLVDRFAVALMDDADPHWHGKRSQLGATPVTLTTRRGLEVLRDSPWELSADDAVWVTGAGIGYMPVATGG